MLYVLIGTVAIVGLGAGYVLGYWHCAHQTLWHLGDGAPQYDVHGDLTPGDPYSRPETYPDRRS